MTTNSAPSQPAQSGEGRLPRVTKGKRPHFFDDPSIDQLMTFILELMTEVSVLRERLDTTERLLDTKGVLPLAELEAYEPDDAVEADRIAWRDGYLRRVLRLHLDEGASSSADLTDVAEDD